MRGVFVTGTDTNVGKTVVAAALMHRYRNVLKLRYWKPIQTGLDEDDDTRTVRQLGKCAAEEILDAGVRLPKPLSPHLAARLEGEKIELKDLLALSHIDGCWVVEGAGGVLVPVNDSQLMIDLIAALKLPLLITARSTLGTINHTLLTLESVRNRGLSVAGVVMVGPPNDENRRAIEEYGKVTVLGEMPWFETLSPDELRRWSIAELDPENVLLKYFNE